MEVSGSSCVAHAQEEVCRVRGLTLHIWHARVGYSIQDILLNFYNDHMMLLQSEGNLKVTHL
jgi:hypothetical protein